MHKPSNNSSSIHLKQTELLFKALPLSTIGSLIAALAIVLIIGPRSDPQKAWEWFFIMMTVSAYRWLTAYFYSGLIPGSDVSNKWNIYFKSGAYMAAVVWGSAMWLIYPIGYPEYQVLLILGLCGVAGGTLAVLSYDSKLIVIYHSILLLIMESRLLWENQQFAMELAALSILYFGFLMTGGHKIGKNYEELITLRQDTEEHNLVLLSTTEKIARIGYWQWDMQSPLLSLSLNLARMCNLNRREASMEECIKMVHQDDRRRVKMAIESVVTTGNDAVVEYRIKSDKDDDWVVMNQIIKRIEDSHGTVSILGTVQDISIIKSAEKKIFDMAYFDELTGLANRSHFHQYLTEQIKQSKRKKSRLAILYIDLDGFKEINDTLGHDKGDEYLKYIATSLRDQLREIDFIARLGGDEFCVILEEINEGIDASNVADRCLALSKNTIEIGSQVYSPRMSIGIAVYPDDGEQVNTLLKAADTAMYSAKQNGKQSYAFYDAQMTTDSIERLQLEADLQNALLNNEFELWYQPKITLSSGKITGVEALIRWQHPVRGMVPPDKFISVAERIGLINNIGEWVLNTACQQQKVWKEKKTNISMAINISSEHFSSKSFSEKISQTINNFALQPGDLEIEITESQTRNPESHIKICKMLQSKGIKVAIDDFGTGYSSLSVLKQLAIDTLKVDQAFIRELPHEPASALMVSTIVNMSLALGYNVVAEGVETFEQAKFLRDLGCPMVQGYYFSKPVTADKILELVENTYTF